jgi:uncharacterized protein DUF4326
MSIVLNARIVGTKPTSNRVYIGRPSIWGNRFVIGRDGNRMEVIVKYGEWLIAHPELLHRVHELRGKDLICWCSPLPCHGHILLRLAND